MSSRRVFEALSHALRESRPPPTMPQCFNQWRGDVAAVARALRAGNQAFDTVRFVADCNTASSATNQG